MDRRDWLTLFVAMEGAPDGLDPVRIQKGMFLFAMEGDVSTGERYQFKPYDYGPMSSGIYSDLEALAAQQLVVREDVQGKHWSTFRATDAGLKAGYRLLRQAQAEGRLDAAQTLHQIKGRVSRTPFSKLLESVYDDYPDYAVKSVFRRSA